MKILLQFSNCAECWKVSMSIGFLFATSVCICCRSNPCFPVFFLLWNSHCALLLHSTAENLRRSTASPELENRWGASSWNRPLISTIIIIPCKELFGFKMDQVNCILAGRLLHASSWECRTSMIRLISVLLCHYCCYRPCTGVPHRKVHTILFAVSSALIYYCALISFGVTMIMMCSAVSQFYCILYCGDLLDFI
jgi:hypothetical protein